MWFLSPCSSDLWVRRLGILHSALITWYWNWEPSLGFYSSEEGASQLLVLVAPEFSLLFLFLLCYH